MSAEDPALDPRVDAAPDVSTQPLVWSTPTFVPGSAGADDPTLTGDLLELYVNLNNDIYLANRLTTTSAWSAFSVVAALSSGGAETTPEVSFDGLTMMLGRDGDIYVSSRTLRTLPWGAPTIVNELNTSTSEAGPTMSTDRRMVVFTSFRKANLSPDVYESTRASATATWGSPVEQTALNTDGHDGSAVLSGDKLRICFDTDRTGDTDLYCSARTVASDPFPAPEPLPAPINTDAPEEDPWFSPDGREIYFYSNRGGMSGLWHARLE